MGVCCRSAVCAKKRSPRAAPESTTFILPSKNKSDLQEIPKKLRQDIKFVLVDHVDEVLEVVLRPPLPVEVEIDDPEQDEESE